MVGFVALAVAALYLGVPLIERYFIYFPDRDLVATPADVGLDYDDVEFTASDGVRLHGWFVPASDDNAGATLLWLHGNAGNISHRVEFIKQFHDELRVGVFIVGYRGYGRSEGTPSEEGLYNDAEAALDLLRAREDVDPRRIVFYGQSLGSAVAVQLATRHRPYAVILESPFTSVPDMAKVHYPLLPIGPILRTRYDSLSKIGDVHAPVLIIHGDTDDTVPVEMGTRLFEAANEPKQLEIIEGAGHNDMSLVGGEGYVRVLSEFLDGID